MTQTSTQAPKKSSRKSRIILLSTFGAFALLFAFCCYIGVLGGNVREIDRGKAYRSATLTGFSYTGITAAITGNSMDNVLKKDKIKTVVNLRGGSDSDDWYRQEVEACKSNGVEHLDFPMSARKLPPPEVVEGLIKTFDHGKFPILIHCQAGSDRTGLASTLYKYLESGQPLDDAQSDQLTWRYGHFPISKTRKMDDFFDLYRKNGNGMEFRKWVHTKYPQLYNSEPQ